MTTKKSDIKTKIEISINKIVLLFIAGFSAGVALVLMWTNNMSLLNGSLQIIAMILVSAAIISSIKKEKDS